ncbi:hypothetical protein NECAME_17299 [Necator americanus]|uniref:Aminoacyl-tRNA synthetase class II (D/K/N) domain-containing protein n=1 Tax=Necator americanus TaxID=51031 RepID=W2TQA6_NECAM|nr:hypothetical protein NECAME_17299 [Necator americanus]ETN83988.1 hypothetical protein NECAME_17299 [Necator americanus]
MKKGFNGRSGNYRTMRQMLEASENRGSTHHPFTAPIDKHRKWLENPSKLHITGQYYDLMLNGVELGDDSTHIHNSEEQARVLKILNEGTTEINHLLNALSCGAPPHGGFALGLDRYIALLVAEGDPSLPVRETFCHRSVLDIPFPGHRIL